MIGTILGIGTGVIVVVGTIAGIRTVRPTHRVIVETFGKYTKTLEPGLHWIFPIVQETKYINTTERMMDVDPQEIITKDNLNAVVDLQVYYKVRKDENNLKKSLYDVQEFQHQVTQLAKTTARNVIGDMKFVEVNSKRNVLNDNLKIVLDKESDAWGVEIVRVEMKEITPPKDVQESMNKIIKAENEKDAAIDLATAAETRADGERRAKIRMAEGIKQSLILEAGGRASAIKIVAEANAEKIKVVNQSIQKNFQGSAKEFKALETTEEALRNGSKYVIDSKSNIMNVMSEASGVVIPTKRKE